MALPLTQLDEAQEGMEELIRSRLGELQSQQETKNLIGELSSRVTDHRGKIRQLLRSEPLRYPEEAPSTPPKPEDGGSRPEASQQEEPTPSTSQPSQQVPEQNSGASDTDSGRADEPPSEEVPPPQSLKVRLPLGLLKCSHQTTTSSSKDGATPSKVRKEPEAKETKTAAPTRPSEAVLSKARFKLYEKDLPEVREVWAQILRLDEGEEVTQEVLDSSPIFQLRWAADETHSPAVIGVHWIDYLDNKGHIAQCNIHDFKFKGKWPPLYTRAGITRHVSGLSSLLKTQGDSPLIAIVPPDNAVSVRKRVCDSPTPRGRLPVSGNHLLW